VKTRIIQDDREDSQSTDETHRSRFASWTRTHRLTAFFVLAYALAWFGWPFYSAGLLLPESIFFAIGPLLAALMVIGFAEGRDGFRDLGARMVRWRVPWYWYAVAIALPLAVRFAGLGLNILAPTHSPLPISHGRVSPRCSPSG
jgi:hypothetical protein